MWIGGRSQTTLWEIGRDENAEGGHGTQKPLECMARPIRNHAGDVYDPFVGSGTTLAAAQLLERAGYAMEIEPAYVAVTLERLSDMGLKLKLVSSTENSGSNSGSNSESKRKIREPQAVETR